MNTELKSRINRIKLQYGLNQEQIAKELGVTRAYLSSVIGGSSPYSDLMKRKLDERFPEEGSPQKEKMIEIPLRTLVQMQDTINSQQQTIAELVGVKAKQNVG